MKAEILEQLRGLDRRRGSPEILCEKPDYREVRFKGPDGDVEVVFTFETPEQALEAFEALTLAKEVYTVCERSHDD